MNYCSFSNLHWQKVSYIQIAGIRSHNIYDIISASLTAECKDGDIRLAGSLPKLAKEKVEVCAKKKWSALCSSNLKIDDVRVVCKQMGYSNDSELSSIWSMLIHISK